MGASPRTTRGDSRIGRVAVGLLAALLAALLVAAATPGRSTASPVPDAAGGLPTRDAATDEDSSALVRLIAKTTDADQVAERLTEEVTVVDASPADEALTVEVPPHQAGEALAVLAGDPAVEYAEPDAPAAVTHVPSDPRYGEQWGLTQTRIPSLWRVTRGTTRTVVAIVDSGVTQTAPDLKDATFVPGYDVIDPGTTPSDGHGHGTQVAGVLAAQHNLLGGAGVCPRCAVMPVRVMGPDGTGWQSDIAEGIEWAADQGADVINLSLGASRSTQRLHDAVRHAVARGALVVAAAGNQGTNTPFYPAAHPETLSVAGSDEAGRRYAWSNAGAWTDLAAPGCNWTVGASGPFCGTSSAAPVVAGMAGLLASADGTASAARLRAALVATAVDVGFVAHGRVSADGTLAALRVEQVPATAELSLSAPRLRFRRPLALSARVLDQRGEAATDIPVTVQRRAAGALAWRAIRRAVTDGAGAVRVGLVPRATATYRLTVPGTRVTSRTATAAVAPVVTLRRSVATAPIASRVRLSGSVAPAHPGQPVLLQRWTPQGWRIRDRTTLSAGSDYRFDVTPRRPGGSRYRIVRPADTDHATGVSKTTLVTPAR